MTNLLERPFFFPVLTTLLFALAIFTGVVEIGRCSGPEPCWGPMIAKGILAIAFIALAGWFLFAFTRADRIGDLACEAEQRASMFRFAYLFSVFSFALLVLPFTAMLRTHESPPDAGPIRLLRACVVLPRPADTAASAASTAPVERCPDSANGSVIYPWLVSVGGVVAHACGPDGAPCSQPPKGEPSPPMYRVQGGFIVPFYVVVFAFIGGVVNLTRRVPEYQKRSSCNFAGSAAEPPVTLLEAREFVIFQIMQMITAPFVAMVAFYAFEPKSVTSAALIGFFAGFATESVLLLLRGMFNGLRPESSTKAVAAGAPTGAQLHARVLLPGGGKAVKAKVELRRLPGDALAAQSKDSDANGDAQFAQVPAGTVWVDSSFTDAGGVVRKSPQQKVQLKAGETESVQLQLA